MPLAQVSPYTKLFSYLYGKEESKLGNQSEVRIYQRIDGPVRFQRAVGMMIYAKPIRLTLSPSIMAASGCTTTCK